jgi:thiol-disulfide isomerase/thioredoxin
MSCVGASVLIVPDQPRRANHRRNRSARVCVAPAGHRDDGYGAAGNFGATWGRNVRYQAMRSAKCSILLLFVAAVLASTPFAAFGITQNWNDAQIHWMSFDEGLEAAKKTNKPVCLIFFTTWCPHCTNYSKLFSNPELVNKSQSFVMIRIDADMNQELSEKYSLDGEYIPRTYFFSPDGTVDPSLSESQDDYKYFYAEDDPRSILAGMDRALKKFQN